ncbi:MAG: DNA primase [Verrucomicrobiales bacterium]|nr:DNA primase [Verrucomicrobiales bacterium]
MPMISPHTREQIRAASDIVEIIGGYLPLRRAGANFVALCPFHREKTPSFHVSPSRQAYHCFGCHKGGDVFRFLQDYENLSFVDAAKRLAERAGIRLEFDDAPGQREERAIQDQLRELHEQITQRWQQALQTDAGGQIARDYLAQRQVPAEAVQVFRLGYAPDAWDDTVNWARGKGWSARLVEQAGLIIPRDPNDPSRGHYDRFRGRLMFPICDEQGRVIGFSGRVLQGDEKTAKYVNSPETPIFTKSRVLYGLDKTKRAILDAGAAIICEGQLDLIACFMAGVQNAVAPQGTALTGDHLRILRRYAQEVLLCFDSDSAGQKAAARVLDELLASGLSVRVITVPAPHDPDSYIREHGPESFRQLAASARDFFEFYLDFLGRQNDLGTDRGRLAVLDAMAVALAKCGNDVMTDRYAQRTAMALAAGGRVALSPDAVRAEFRKRAARGARSQAPQRTRTPPPEEIALFDEGTDAPAYPTEPPTPQEFWLLKLLFLNDEFAGWLALHLDPLWIRHAGVRALVESALQHHQAGTWISPAALLGDLSSDVLRSLASEAMSDNRPIPNPEQQLSDLTLRLRNTWIDQQMAQVTAQAAQPELPDPERTTLLLRLQELRQTKRSPLSARLQPDASPNCRGDFR